MKLQKKSLAALVLCGCMLSMPQTVSYAAPTYEESEAMMIGPGYSMPAYEKMNGVYYDEQGAPIEGAIMRGISVSKWQGNIDWSRVAQDDVSFAMIRMMSYGYEGGYTMDEYFDRNMREAAAHGIKTAPYVYLQTKTVEEAKAAARFAVEKAKQYDVSFPIAVDVESEYILELSKEELTDVVNAFCDVIREAGYTPILYSDHWKLSNEMDTSRIPVDVWMARYGAGSEYPNRTIWQPTDKGRVAGIDGYVCLEFAYRDYSAIPETEGYFYIGGDGRQYFSNGTANVTGWVRFHNAWYYMDPATGVMVSGTSMNIDGTDYVFNDSGVMQ